MPTVKSKATIPVAPSGFAYYRGKLWEIPDSFLSCWVLALRDFGSGCLRIVRWTIIAFILALYASAFIISVWTIWRVSHGG